MKIISKYKDFYDHMWIDEDPEVVYVRKAKVHYSLISELCYGNIPNGCHIGSGTRTDRFPKIGEIGVVGFTFGIYPYVYTSPAISIKVNDVSFATKCLTKSEVDFIRETKDKKKQCEYIENISREHLRNEKIDCRDVFVNSVFGMINVYNNISSYCWKIERQEVFEKLESPVFVVFSDCLIDDAYRNSLDIKCLDSRGVVLHPHYITDVCFSKLSFPIMKYWFDDINTINTYSDIENFLITSKMDPEPVISNDGKIIAHGFDLKTSFRKM